MKKVCCLLFALVLGCLLVLPLQASAETEGIYEYTVSDGQATITYCDSSVSGDIVIPDTLGGYPVTAIGAEAFLFCEGLTGVTFSDSVTTIGELAFLRCENMTSVTIPENVTTIGDDAFYGCIGLTGIWVSEENPSYSSDDRGVLFDKNKTALIQAPGKIVGSYTIPNGVAVVGDYAFYNCKGLTSVTIPDSAITIEDGAFFGCCDLTSATIGDGVTTIGNGIFYGCTGLTTLTIPDSVTSIGVDVFSSCDNLAYNVYDNAKYLGNSANPYVLLVEAAAQNVTSCTINQNTKLIGHKAFGMCEGLTEVIIPDGVRMIGSYAFGDCESLTSVTVPDSVTTIDDFAFSGCKSLTTVSIPSNVTYIGYAVFRYCDSLTYNIYDNAKYLGNSADPYVFLVMAAADDIASCSIHPDTKLINDFAFEGCGSLHSVTVPGGVTTIGDSAFYGCSSLSSVIIGDGVQTIRSYAFAWCTALTEITIPDSVTGIGGCVFENCDSLVSIWVSENNSDYSSDDRGVLFNKDKTALDQAPGGITGGYEIPESVTDVYSCAFSGCKQLTAVAIPNTVTEIAYATFYGCTGLKELTIPVSVTVIGYEAFGEGGAPENVYYTGTEDQWNQIEVIDEYHALESANVYFECDPSMIMGDLDDSGIVDEDDAIYLLQHVLMPDLFPVAQGVDYDGSGSIDEDDAIYLLQHVLMPDLFPLTPGGGESEPEQPVNPEDMTREERAVAEAEVRRAISLLMDRDYIVNGILQFGQAPANTFVADGMLDSNGESFRYSAGQGDGKGYYAVDAESYDDNYNEAIEILKKYYSFDEATGKFTNFPMLHYIYNTNESHKVIAEYIQGVLNSVGISMNLEHQEWNTFLNSRKDGEYSIARNGWVADYTDPMCFLDMWVTESGNNDAQFGKGDHANLAIYDLDLSAYGYSDIKVTDGTWAETYDVLIDTIRSCEDGQTRDALMHLAEDMLMETGCLMPLYYYTDLYMVSPRIQGFYATPLGYKYFQNTTVDGEGDSLSVCLGSEPDTLDPALNSSVDGATILNHLFSGLAKWSQKEDGTLEVVADCAEELVEGVANEDGTVTYTYTLKDGLKWSDGKDLTAKDFEFAWKRAASDELGADYGYLFDIVQGYGTGNKDDLAVKALDSKTLEVTLNSEATYWNELLAFPTYFPVREDIVADESWATDPLTYVSNGAYTFTAWEHDAVITMERNENYHGEVTMNELKFYLSDDAYNMLYNYKNGDWLIIDDVPMSEIDALKTEYPEEFVVAGQMGTYYVNWNVNESLLPVA